MVEEKRIKSIDKLHQVLQTDRKLRLVEKDIYSVLPETQEKPHYDKIAPVYDLVVGTSFYNSLMWGCSAKNYTEFVRQALNSNQNGLFLEAGCGSMLFTSQAFCESERTIIAFDYSLEMLRRARKRLLKTNGSFPSNVVLLQADIFDLPFCPKSFQTILSLAVVHLFEDTAGFVRNLHELLVDEGSFYISSLAQTTRLTDIYLKFLSKTGAGGIAQPKTDKKLKEIFTNVLGEKAEFQTKGNFVFAKVSYK